MSQTAELINEFNGSLDMCTPPSALKKGDWTMAWNMVERDLKYNQYISNEQRDIEILDFGSMIVGSTTIKERNQIMYWLDNGEIWIQKTADQSKIFVASDKEFGCDWNLQGCEWIYGEFKTMQPCNELHVYWSSGCTGYWLNIDLMLDSERKAALKATIKAGIECKDDPKCKENCGTKACDYFKVMKTACAPKITPNVHQEGGALPAGAYQYIVMLEDRDGSTTNWFNLTDPVYVGSENNIPGETGRGHVTVMIDGLDCRFSKVNLGVIRTIDNSQTGKLIEGIGYSSKGISYNHYGNEGIDIDPKDFLVKRKTFHRYKDQIQRDGSLFIYSLMQDKELDYQQWANQIVTEQIMYEFTIEEARLRSPHSMLRGEAYQPYIHWNFTDGTYTVDFPIPAGVGGGGGVSGLTSSNANNATDSKGGATDKLESRSSTNSTFQGEQGSAVDDGGSPTASDITIDYTPPYHIRKRTAKRNSTGNTFADDTSQGYEKKIDDIVKTIETDVSKYCQAMGCFQTAPCTQCPVPKQVCDADGTKFDELVNNWLDMTTGYLQDDLNIDATIDYSPAKLKDSASKIISAINKRERVTRTKGKFTVSGGDSAPTGSGKLEQRGGGEGTDVGSQESDSTGHTQTTELLKGKNLGPTKVKLEKNATYPEMKDCKGRYVFRELAGQPIRLHRINSAAESPFFKSGSRGVPSKVSPGVDEHNDGFIYPIGLKFSNIRMPKEGIDTTKTICKINPFTITYARRDDSNKSIFAKGLALNTYVSQNQGKDHVYSHHGLNSFETVEVTIDIDGSHKGTDNKHSSFIFHSLDTHARKQTLPITGFVPELEMYGVGWRHGVCAKGREPQNQMGGNQVDQLGARQAVNLSQFVAKDGNYESPKEATGVRNVRADSVASSPTLRMGKEPLMNKYREGCVWVGGDLPALTKGVSATADSSFVGDTLDHSAPIEKAAAMYVALVADKPDQYGFIGNQHLIPLLQGTAKTTGDYATVEGICGDTFIAPYSFKRTSYVSDKVGELYDIPNAHVPDGRPTPQDKKEKRSVCDSPEDPIFGHNGLWYPTKLPESGDIADAKNWAGLHTVGSRVSDWKDAANKKVPETDVYYFKVVSTLITFWGESETNPYLLTKGDPQKGEVNYPNIGPLYLDSAAPADHPWPECYLNRFGVRVEQPSKAKLVMKTAIRTIMNIIAPAMEVNNLINVENFSDATGFFVGLPMMAALWYLLTQVLYTNDFIDQLLGIASCKTDSEGLSDAMVMGLEDNYCKANWDFVKLNDQQPFMAISEPYYTCDCSNCLAGQTNNGIYYSNKQNLTSSLDSYKNFQSLDYLMLPASAGKLMKLFIESNVFYAHTTDAIWPIQFNATPVNNDISFYLGSGTMLSNPRQLGEGIGEGYAGLQDPNSAISTQWGYIFPDRDARCIYIFKNGQLRDITSGNKMFNFFKQYLNFCTSDKCRDEKVKGIYYSLGVDPRLKRLLVTKKDGDSSWTLSYDLENKDPEGGWKAFHNYLPNAYVWDRDDLYKIQGSKVLMQSNNDGGEQGDNSEELYTIFDGVKYPCMIETVINSQSLDSHFRESFQLNSLFVSTEANKLIGKNQVIRSRDITFDEIALWNSYQTAGSMKLKVVSTMNGLKEDEKFRIQDHVATIVAQFQSKGFFIDEFRDLTGDDCAPLIEYDSKCSPFYKPVNYDFKKFQQDGRETLDDTYYYVRFTLNSVHNVKLYLRYIIANITRNES